MPCPLFALITQQLQTNDCRNCLLTESHALIHTTPPLAFDGHMLPGAHVTLPTGQLKSLFYLLSALGKGITDHGSDVLTGYRACRTVGRKSFLHSATRWQTMFVWVRLSYITNLLHGAESHLEFFCSTARPSVRSTLDRWQGSLNLPSMISGFRRGVENCAVHDYAASNDNSLPTFRDSLSVPA
jgi:hypothetical protein